MKKVLFALCLGPSLVLAKPVSFDFAAVSLVTFGQATFKSIMNRDYVVSPDVVALDRKITISVKNIDSADVPRFVENLLLQQGITTTLKDGVYYLTATNAQNGVQDRQGAASDPRQPATLAASAQEAMYGKNLIAELTPPNSEGMLRGQNQAAMAFRRPNDESATYVPKNRTTDFLAAALGAAFGQRSVLVAGSTLVLSGSSAELKKMTLLLDALDVEPVKVDVSASWIEVTRSDGGNRGISLLANVLGARLGVSLGTFGSSSVSLKSSNFELVLEALNTDGRFKQVSNSRVVTESYVPAFLGVGDETPTVASSGKDNSGNAVQNIVYRPSGVIVDVTPKVLGSGRINLVIDGQISNFKATQNGVTGSPTLIKRQVKTTVTVDDGEVLLIGGLNDSQSTESKSGLAFLPSSWSLSSGSNVQTDLVLILSAKLPR